MVKRKIPVAIRSLTPVIQPLSSDFTKSSWIVVNFEQNKRKAYGTWSETLRFWHTSYPSFDVSKILCENFLRSLFT
jgi:hypothetical protein